MSMISRQKLIEELNIIERFYLHDDNEICNMSGHECYPQDECPLCMLERIRNFIKSQPPADQWIPCDIARPTESGIYWATVEVYWSDEPVSVEIEYDCKTDEWKGGYDVLAWMITDPPEPYKGGGVDG